MKRIILETLTADGGTWMDVVIGTVEHVPSAVIVTTQEGSTIVYPYAGYKRIRIEAV